MLLANHRHIGCDVASSSLRVEHLVSGTILYRDRGEMRKYILLMNTTFATGELRSGIKINFQYKKKDS